MFRKLAIIGAALLLTSSGGVLACQGTGDTVLDDKFNPPETGWGAWIAELGGNGAFTPQGMTITPTVNGAIHLSNPHYTMDGTDLCVSVTLPATLPSPANSDTLGDVGIAFWIKDDADYYTAVMSPDGNAKISRRIAGEWVTPPIYGPTASSAIKTAAGSTNEIEIMVSGRRGSFYINGTKITDFGGQPPPNGGPPGLYAESGSSAVTTWLFPRVQLY
jgi:hypothetical protein